MKRVVVAVLVLFTFFSNASGQDWAKVKQPEVDLTLKIGDHVPLAELHNMINYPKKSLKFDEHKPKLFILDFWGVRCVPCIKFWPDLLSLQKEFGKDLQIILVDKYDNEKRVSEFVAARKKIHNVDMNLPISCRDSATWKYFPQMDVPRYVWIDSNGVIQAITRTEKVNSDNIATWIQNGPYKVGEIAPAIQFQAMLLTQPIFVNGNGGERTAQDFLWSSSLTKGQNDVSASSVIFHNEDDGYGMTLTGCSIVNLYATAYNNRPTLDDYFDFLPLGRVELIAPDSSKYFRNKQGGNSFNYQLLAGSPKTRNELLKIMRADLDRFFGLEVKWEKRVKKCLVFTMPDKGKVKGKSLGGELEMKGDELVMDSVTMKETVSYMELSTVYRMYRYPIIDETNYEGLLTGIRTVGNTSNPLDLDRMLSKYGIRFKYEMREVDVLVLREPVTAH